MNGYTNLRGQTNICFSYNALNLRLNVSFFLRFLLLGGNRPPLKRNDTYHSFFCFKIKINYQQFFIPSNRPFFDTLRVSKKFHYSPLKSCGSIIMHCLICRQHQLAKNIMCGALLISFRKCVLEAWIIKRDECLKIWKF